MSELEELRASLARAQRELDLVHERVDALDNAKGSSATVLAPRVVERRRRQMIAVGVASSLATAALFTFGIVLLSPKPEPPPAPAPVAVAPPPSLPSVAMTPPPPPVISVASPEPPPPPEPPPRMRTARVSHVGGTPVAPAPRDPRESEFGSLSIVCMPKCDAITDNGVALGPGHIFNRPVPAGTHRITLHAPNGQTKQLTLDVHADQLREVRVAMQSPSDVF